jgi:predicted porin
MQHSTQRVLAKKSMLCAALIAGMAMSAGAMADDSPLTWMGITFYGTYDIGIAYQSHGINQSQYFYPGLQYMIGKTNDHAMTQVAPNGLSQSKIGLRGKEDINDEFSFIFNWEMGFQPDSFNISDSSQSLVNNNGKAVKNQQAAADGSRTGTWNNGQSFLGLATTDYGTLTYGRQNSLLLDNINKYDPMNGSYAFSIIGYSGVTGGMGDTEDTRLDNAIKYVYKYGMFHVGALYQNGVYTSPGTGYQGDIGFDYAGFSVDGVYGHKNDAISAGSLSAAQIAPCAPGKTSGCGLPTDSLSATISDNTSYTLDASYTWEGFKFYGGYEHIKYQNPSDPLAAGFNGLGDYYFSVTNNAAYLNPKVLQVSWIGAKYLITKNFDVTFAYYHYDQNSYGAKSCSNNSASTCAGAENVLSARADYRFNKYFDVYAGVAHSQVGGGLANGYLYKTTYDPMIGVRFQF